MRTTRADNPIHACTGRDAGLCLCILCCVLATSGCGGGQGATSQTTAEPQDAPPAAEAVVVRRVELAPATPVRENPAVVRRIDLEAPHSDTASVTTTSAVPPTVAPVELTPVLPPAPVVAPAVTPTSEPVVVVTHENGSLPSVPSPPVSPSPVVPVTPPVVTQTPVVTPVIVPQVVAAPEAARPTAVVTAPAAPVPTPAATPNQYQTCCELPPECTAPVIIWFVPQSPPPPVVYNYQWSTTFPMYPLPVTLPATSPLFFPPPRPQFEPRRRWSSRY